MSPKTQKINFKINIFVFSLVIFFGVFWGVEKADAKLNCCINEFNDCNYTTRATCARVQETIVDCMNPPTPPIYSKEVCFESVRKLITDCSLLGNKDECDLLPDKCFYSKNRVKCLSKEDTICAGLIKEDCDQVSKCISKDDGTCMTLSANEAIKKAPGNCADSPLGCNLKISELNKLNLGEKGVAGVREMIGRAIRIMMGIVGSIALVMFVAGGLMWMTAAGNSERIAKAMRIIVWAGLGVVVIFSAYALVQFVFSAF